MTKDVVKSEALADNQGALDVGVDTTGGLAGPKVQHALADLLAKVNARIGTTRYNGGAAVTFRSSLNFKGNVSLADNPGLGATDVEILEPGFRWMGLWSGSSVAYLQDDAVRRNGSMYVAKNNHTSAAGSPPETNTTNWDLAVSAGAAGAGPGGVHGPTHKGDGVDPIPAATTTVDGLLSFGDKTKLDGVETGAKATHNNLSGLTTGDPHTQYALADGSRLLLPTSVTSPGTSQIRRNGTVLEYWDGDSWERLRAGVDVADLQAGYSVVLHVTSLARPTSALEGQVIFETDTNVYMRNQSETFASPSWTPLVPSVTSWKPPYAAQSGANSVYALWGEGDVSRTLAATTTGQVSGPKASQLSTTVVRLVKFRLPNTLTADNFRVFCYAGDASPRYRFGIYLVSTGAKTWDSGSIAPGTTGSWTVNTTGFPITILADTDYWLAWTATSAQDAVHFRTASKIQHPNVMANSLSPAAGRSLGIPDMRQVATTGGTLPTTLPAVPTFPNWDAATGTIPYCYLTGTST